jgi:hypothetical protein
MAATYYALSGAVAPASAKSMLGILNGAGSGVVLTIRRVWVVSNNATSVTGVVNRLTLCRVSALSSGTTLSAVSLDSTNSAVPEAVLIRTGATATETAGNFRSIITTAEEMAVSLAAMPALKCMYPLNLVFDSGYGEARVQPIILREGEGIHVKHQTSSTVGTLEVVVEFTIGTPEAGRLSTFSATARAIAPANNKYMLTIMNPASSGKIVKVWRMWLLNSATSSVSGIMNKLELRRISARTAGTSITCGCHDTAATALGTVAVDTLSTAVSEVTNALIRRIVYSSDEITIAAVANDELETLQPLMCIWDGGYGDANVNPIVLREGQGLTLKNVISTKVGTVELMAEFSVE